MTATATIRPMTAADWPAVEAIHRAGIDTGNATFEAEPPSWEQFDAGKLEVGRFVAVDARGAADGAGTVDGAGAVVGWIAASPVSARQVYRGVIEHSVYVSPTAAGRGVGRQLVEALIAAADDAGYWTIQSSIFPENTTSLALHDRAGFRRIGTRERIALMTYGPWAGRWRDTVLIERRTTADES